MESTDRISVTSASEIDPSTAPSTSGLSSDGPSTTPSSSGPSIVVAVVATGGDSHTSAEQSTFLDTVGILY